MAAEERSAIVTFLEGEGRDGRGRTLSDLLAFGDEDMERHHDYIQWLFPLGTPSRAVPGSPVLSTADIAAIRASPACQRNLAQATARMIRFYAENDHWLVPFDHNHLRITRIVTALRTLVGQEAAGDFHGAIVRRVAETGRPVAQSSRKHWDEALNNQEQP